jgi:hypothetical protein
LRERVLVVGCRPPPPREKTNKLLLLLPSSSPPRVINMAVYFANKIGAPGTSSSSPTSLAWSRHATHRKGPANGSPLVAVAFESGAVGVYTGELHALFCVPLVCGKGRETKTRPCGRAV